MSCDIAELVCKTKRLANIKSVRQGSQARLDRGDRSMSVELNVYLHDGTQLIDACVMLTVVSMVFIDHLFLKSSCGRACQAGLNPSQRFDADGQYEVNRWIESMCELILACSVFLQ